MKRFLADDIKPMIELLSTSLDKIRDAKVKETFTAMLHEYRKLKLAVLIFSRIMDMLNTMPIDIEECNVEEIAKSISVKIMR